MSCNTNLEQVMLLLQGEFDVHSLELYSTRSVRPEQLSHVLPTPSSWFLSLRNIRMMGDQSLYSDSLNYFYIIKMVRRNLINEINTWIRIFNGQQSGTLRSQLGFQTKKLQSRQHQVCCLLLHVFNKDFIIHNHISFC